ncbi:MAG: peptidase S41 [Acidobacteria bacterium]|nr:MAG: peptidase S41 [Acidobacteriota bacterium]
MRRLLLILLCMTRVSLAQESPSGKMPGRSDLAAILSFEAEPSAGMPGGWGGGPPGTVFADDKVVHGGRWSARIERNTDSPSNFSTITKSIPMDFLGKMIELRGFLRTEDVSDFVGLWMREDGESPALAFDNMQSRQLKGTTAWTEYSVTLPVHPEARQLFFGVLVSGTGKAWADDLQLLVDGKPVWEAPEPKTALDFDHEFDSGSGIPINKLTDAQTQNLVTLGKVWGFLKYYHPQVTTGQRHWDYDLFRILPAILEARDRSAANAVLLHWIASLGAVASCNPCAKLEEGDLQFGPDLDWITNAAVLGADLSQKLRFIRDNRLPGKQFYVSLSSAVGNPSFDHELSYPTLKIPDSGFQLLSLYRFWNIIEYWSPNRNVLGQDWNGVLAQFIPRIAMAKNADSYNQELLALVARAHDGHSNLPGSLLDSRPPTGKCQLPVNVRFVENVPVISEFQSADLTNRGELKIGDVITELDGVPVSKLVETWKPYYAASNEAGRMRNIGRFMTRGECGESDIAVRRENLQVHYTVKRVPAGNSDPVLPTHDLPGPTFRLLSKDVAYLKLSSVKAADAAHYIDSAAGTKGLIIDIRNYPSEFMVFALGSFLVESETPFARFTFGDLSNPGAFHWGELMSLSPQKPHYSGKIVILVDEISISQSEYTAMAFRSAHESLVVGSTTAGADGNVSHFVLPGELRSMISGIGVFYPNKAATQRIGIVPNVIVNPTIAGIRAGRDEVLEEALRQILGGQVSGAEIQKMAKP